MFIMLPLSILLKLISLDFIIRLLKFEDSLPLEAEYKLFLAIKKTNKIFNICFILL